MQNGSSKLTWLAAVAPGSAQQVGEYCFAPAEDHWWWSNAVYAMFGFAPGEVVPSTDLIVRHLHAAGAMDAVTEAHQALRDGRPVCTTYRIVDARRRERTLVTVARPVVRPDGQEEIRGYVVDLTELCRSAAQAEVEAAVTGATVHRAAIDQAKGMLMVLEGVSGDAAFELLRDYSQLHNIKLRVLAERLVDALGRAERPVTREELDRLVAEVSVRAAG